MSLSEVEPLIAQLPVAVFRTTPEGRFLAANEAMARLLGASSVDELAGVDVASLYVDRSVRRYMMRRVDERVEIPAEEIELEVLDGRRIWVRVNSRGVRDDEGNVLYYEGILEDVTEAHATSIELMRSNSLLDTLTRIQNRFIVGVDPGQVFDQLLEDLLEITESEYGFIARLHHDEDGHPFLRTTAMSNIAWNDVTRALFAEHGPRGMEFHNMKTLFGRVVTSREAVISNDPSSDTRAGGSPYGHPPLDAFLGIPILKGSDVVGMVAVSNRPGGYDEALVERLRPVVATVGSLFEALRSEQARRNAEERERGREELYRAVVEYAAEAVIAFDEGGIVEAFNPAAEGMTGYLEREVVGRHVEDFLPRDLSASGAAVIDGVAPDHVTVDAIVRHLDGRAIPVEVSFGRTEIGGRSITTAILRNVAERRAIENALREAKESAERTSRAKDEFLAGMSHELRTPLNAVIGLSTILGREVHGPVNLKQGEYLTQIESAGRHLLELINDILDLAKIEADKLELDRGPVQTAALVKSAVTVVREAAIGKRIRFQMDVDGDALPVFADSRRAKQVLINLLSNAIKFTDFGGSVGVRAVVEDDQMALVVWDTGIGIPADRFDDVFAPFEQLDSSLARSHEGTGLGLSLSRKFAELHGGSLTVESEVGEGSRFTFRLPLFEDALAGSVAAEPVEPFEPINPDRLVRTRVLVVEDNDINRMMVVDYLEAHGLSTASALDGDEAVRKARQLQPDVIIMDVQLPNRDGLSATRELKSDPLTSGIPVIALTALAMKGDETRCLEAGCDGYLSKPCDPADVLAAIEAAVAVEA